MDNYPVQHVYQPPVAPPQKKQYLPFDRKDFVFMALYLVAAFLVINFGLFSGVRLGFTIAYVFLFVITTIYIARKGNRPEVFPVICGCLSVVGSVTFALFNDYLINFFMLILVGGLYVIYTIGLSGSFNFRRGSFRMLFDVVLDLFFFPFRALPDVFCGIKLSTKKNRRSVSALLGVVIALPFVFVIGALLVNSDAAFEGLVDLLFKNIAMYILHFALAFLVLPYAFANAYAKRKSLNHINTDRNSAGKRGVPTSACVSFLSVISVLYVVYLLSQLAYFFSAFSGILPADYKYSASAFARRGFYEMFVICAINVVIISVITAISKKKTIVIKILSCFISLFSVLLIVVAMQKMRLNISVYGLSCNRVLVSVFMIMMLVVIALFIIHIFAPKVSYMQTAIVVCSVIFIALSYADIDARVAQYNINAYNNGSISTIDIDDIADLSSSALPYLVDLTKSDDPDIAAKAMIASAQYAVDMKTNVFDGSEDDNSDFRSFCLSRMYAVLALDDAEYSEGIADTIDKIESGDYFYNSDEGYFEKYDDHAREYHYDPDTHKFDKVVTFLDEEETVCPDGEMVIL